MCSGKECVEYSKFLGGKGKPVFRGGWDVVDNRTIGELAGDAGRDDAIFRHLSLEPGQRFFFMPVRLVRKKNIPAVVRAFERFRGTVDDRPLVRLVICGRGPLERDIRRMVAGRGIGDAVRLVPWLPHDRVPRACRLAEAVVLASTHDQWGLVVNEALAAGAPVLVSDRCGAHELVKNNVNGFTFAPEDEHHLAELFAALAGHRGLVDRLRRNAAPSVERFSVREFTGACLEAFRRFGVLRGGRGRRARSLKAAGRGNIEPVQK
jgi:glycosyltransferase involved in cell wall biosynthesis